MSDEKWTKMIRGVNSGAFESSSNGMTILLEEIQSKDRTSCAKSRDRRENSQLTSIAIPRRKHESGEKKKKGERKSYAACKIRVVQNKIAGKSRDCSYLKFFLFFLHVIINIVL